MRPLRPGVANVSAKVGVDERNISTAPRLIVGVAIWSIDQTGASSGGHGSPVVNPVGTAWAGLELQLMVLTTAGEVLSHDIVAASLGALGLLVITVARCGGSVEGSSRRLVVVNEDDNVLPVVAMTTDEVAISRLVLGPVPSVHDGKFAVVHSSTGIGLAL